MKMKKGLTLSAFVMSVSIAMLGGVEKAQAHATSIGFENGGSAGVVNIWLGTYNHGGHHLEGSMNLVGVNGNTYASTTNPFTLGAGVGMTSGGAAADKPSGLVDGITNFYSPGGCVLSSSALGGTANTCSGGVNHWQGAVFAGLGAGDYQFNWTPIARPSAEWSLINTNMNGIFSLGGSVVTGTVPEPGALALLGFGLAGISFLRRKKQA